MKLKEWIETHPAVNELWNEGVDGWWASLKNGWIDAESGCHVIHESTLTKVASRLRQFVKPCMCKDCKPMSSR